MPGCISPQIPRFTTLLDRVDIKDAVITIIRGDWGIENCLADCTYG